MGCFGSKDKLSKEDMEFLKTHTRYDESTIKEWYKGFKVSINFHGELYDEVLRWAFIFCASSSFVVMMMVFHPFCEPSRPAAAPADEDDAVSDITQLNSPQHLP